MVETNLKGQTHIKNYCVVAFPQHTVFILLSKKPTCKPCLIYFDHFDELEKFYSEIDYKIILPLT